MSYKTYRFEVKDALESRSGSDGFLMKFISKDGRKFIKMQCIMGGVLLEDWKVEVIASKLCEHFSIYHIKQEPCNIILDNRDKIYKGVVSENLRTHGYSTLSFGTFLENNGYSTHDDWFVKSNPVEKIERLSNLINSIDKSISKESVRNYLIQCAMIDILVYNNDRHIRNYNFIIGKDIKLRLAPLHDFGMGLFEHDYSLKDYSTWQECDRYSYIAPFGESAFILLEMLDKEYGIRKQYKKVTKPIMDKRLFPSTKAYEYYKVICKEIWQ